MNNVGRNDPCPCGSGRKYKTCCLMKSIAPVACLGWQKMRRTEGGLVEPLFDYAINTYGKASFTEAWNTFTLFKDAPVDQDICPELDTLFPTWFVFNWMPDNFDVVKDYHFPEMPVALHYLKQKASSLDSYQRRFIEEACSQEFSFFKVIKVESGKHMILQDLF